MTYKKKTAVLLALIVFLAAVYILSFVFDPENRRSSAFAWLEIQHQYMADGIEIFGVEGWVFLTKMNDIWFLRNESGELPVKQEKVADLFALLRQKNVYPVRLSSSEGLERHGLTESIASRIIVRGGPGLPLVELLVGFRDALGREVYLRKGGTNQVFSTEDGYSAFIEMGPSSWYDLRLFLPESNLPGSVLTADKVQSFEILHPENERIFLRRSGGGWILIGNENLQVESIMVEAWLRLLLEAEGDGFDFNVPEAFDGSITLHLGDGSSRTLQVGPTESIFINNTVEENSRRAVISGSSFVYALTEQSFNHLFRDITFFLRD